MLDGDNIFPLCSESSSDDVNDDCVDVDVVDDNDVAVVVACGQQTNSTPEKTPKPQGCNIE